MADQEDPYAKYVGAAQAPPDDDPYAKYVKKVGIPSVIEDVAKTAAPSVLRGTLAAITAPRAISDLTGKGVNWAINKVAPDSTVADYANKFHNFDTGMGDSGPFPSYEHLKGAAEHFTGPLYDAQTPVGKGAQVAIEAVPSLAAGGEGLLPTAVRAIGSGIGSAGLGEAASGLKGAFPNSVPDWAEPVARGVGALAGGVYGPSASRKAITPLPMSDERLATVNALKQSNPELVNASTAGQLTESPGIAAMEARSPRMVDLPARQEAAYTQGVMRQAGSDGMFDTPGLAQAKARGGELDALQNAHEMNPSQYGLFSQYAASRNLPGSELYKEVGPSKAYQDVVDAIRNGPSGGVPAGNPAPASMTGPRFGVMKQELQKAGEAAPTTHEGQAIFDLRQRMKTAFQNSMPDDQAQHLRDLDQQYSNYMTIKDAPAKVGENTLTPNKVFQRAERGSPLETHATQADSVMKPLPTPNTEGGFGTKVAGGGLGAVAGAVPHFFGHNEAAMVGIPFASYYGLNHLNDFIQAGKNVAGRVVAHPVTQGYLKNQLFRPGNPAFDNDPATVLRLLMAPTDRNAVSHDK